MPQGSCWRSAAVVDAADLVIGIGNPLRGDDGVGWWLAERAEQLPPATPTGSALLVRAVQQLTPELSGELAAVRRVLFIDAWWPPVIVTSNPPQDGQAAPEPPSDPPAPARHRDDPSWTGAVAAIQPCLRRLSRFDGAVEAGAFSHALDPAQLLAITTLLQGTAPEAWQLLVPAAAMPHGKGFSAQMQRLLPGAEALLLQWCAGGGERRGGRASAHA